MYQLQNIAIYSIIFINKESQINELKKFKKSAFDIDQIMNTASQLKYSNEFKNIFAQDLQNPSDDLVRYFLSNVYSGQKNSSVIEKFKPLVKTALNQFVTEMMNDKIKTALGNNDVEIDPNQEIEISDNKEEPEKIRIFKIITT